MDCTILTPVYDEPLALVKRNITSVMLQKTCYKFEHLVVIDNPNISVEILNYLYNNTDVNYYIHKENKGLSASRNTALKNASGEFIMILDCDDVFAPGRIQKQLEFMKQNEIFFSYGGFQEIHGQELEPKPTNNIHIPQQEDLLECLKQFKNAVPCGSVCFKKEIYDKLGGFDENMKEGSEDMEFQLRAVKAGYKIGLLPEVLYYLGVHDNNQTAKLIRNGGFQRANEYIRKKYPNITFIV